MSWHAATAPSARISSHVCNTICGMTARRPRCSPAACTVRCATVAASTAAAGWRPAPFTRPRQQQAPQQLWRGVTCRASRNQGALSPEDAIDTHAEPVVEKAESLSTTTPAVEPILLFEGFSELNGPIQIQQVPQADFIPQEIQGSRLLYMGLRPRLLGVYRPIGDPHPLTYAYWDYFATLPVLLGEGPIAMYGWCGGTPARLLTEVFDPPPKMIVWEMDKQVIEACRQHMGLDELQKAAPDLEIRLGDPLDPSSSIPGGFAAIIVDLFINGTLHPLLLDEETWQQLRSRLVDGGPERGPARLMVHLGPATNEDGTISGEVVVALNTLTRVFGEVHYIDPPEGSQLDVIAVTGPLPDRDEWAAAVGPALAPYTVDWELWEEAPVTAAELGLEELDMKQAMVDSEDNDGPAAGDDNGSGGEGPGREEDPAARQLRLMRQRMEWEEEQQRRRQEQQARQRGAGGVRGPAGPAPPPPPAAQAAERR